MKIVVLDGFTLNPGDLTWNALKALGDVTLYDRTEAADILKRSKGAEIILTNKTPLSADTLNELKGDLKYIGVLATGYNVVDVEAAKELGILVTNIPTYGTSSVAQMAVAHILNFTQRVREHAVAVADGRWTAQPDFCFWDFPLIELEGKTVGVIGFGRIGQRFADMIAGFGCKVIAYDAFPSDQSARKNFEWVDLDRLFKESDVISLHCPLFRETEGIVNAENLKKMKKTALIVNTSRGPLIVEKDLAEALNNGTIAGASLDVVSSEPIKADNPLLKAKNCWITPHISWATGEARARLMDIAVDNVAAFQKGSPVNVVNA